MSLATSGGVWLLTPPNLIAVSIHDEGFIAAGAMLIFHGKLPYRDFLSFYGLPFTELNLTASSNGVHELDDFINTHYAERAAFGAERGMRYTILQPRSHAS